MRPEPPIAPRQRYLPSVMSDDLPALSGAISGTTANGVPFVALPPAAGQDARTMIVAWHGADPPRSEEALAAAVPMLGLPAWRVYLGMPLYGRRRPEGGFEEVMHRYATDAVALGFHPSIAGAVSELPGAVQDLRLRLVIDPALPLGIFGFSQGGAAALLSLSNGDPSFNAALTVGAVIDMAGLIDSLAALYGIPYEWTPERLALAEELTSRQRAPALAASGAALLLAVGAEDPYPLREDTEQLGAAVRAAGGRAQVRVLPEIAHAFVEEPGEAPAPQGEAARAVDELATGWFRQHLI